MLLRVNLPHARALAQSSAALIDLSAGSRLYLDLIVGEHHSYAFESLAKYIRLTTLVIEKDCDSQYAIYDNL